jgi:hypothetical protein
MIMLAKWLSCWYAVENVRWQAAVNIGHAGGDIGHAAGDIGAIDRRI